MKQQRPMPVFAVVSTQPTRYMGIETFRILGSLFHLPTQPTRYMGIETS